MAQDDGSITVKIVCRECNNANRAARRACSHCGHSGYEGERVYKPDSDGTLKIGPRYGVERKR